MCSELMRVRLKLCWDCRVVLQFAHIGRKSMHFSMRGSESGFKCFFKVLGLVNIF